MTKRPERVRAGEGWRTFGIGTEAATVTHCGVRATRLTDGTWECRHCLTLSNFTSPPQALAGPDLE